MRAGRVHRRGDGQKRENEQNSYGVEPPTSFPSEGLKQGPSTRCARSGFRLRARTPAKRLKMRAVSGCRLDRRQLSRILQEGVYAYEEATARTQVTVECDNEASCRLPVVSCQKRTATQRARRNKGASADLPGSRAGARCAPPVVGCQVKIKRPRYKAPS